MSSGEGIGDSQAKDLQVSEWITPELTQELGSPVKTSLGASLEETGLEASEY